MDCHTSKCWPLTSIILSVLNRAAAVGGSRTQGRRPGTGRSGVSALFWEVLGSGTRRKHSGTAVGFMNGRRIHSCAILVKSTSGRRGRLIGSLGNIMAVWGRKTGPRGEKMAGGFTGTDSQDLATILDPFRKVFAELGPDRLSET